jgi:hypothetical protein
MEICIYSVCHGSVLSLALYVFNCLVLYAIPDNLADGQNECQNESKQGLSETVDADVDDVLK